MSSRQRRSANGVIGPHRMGSTEPLSHAQGTTDFNPSIFRALLKSNIPIHAHIMHHTEANKSHEFTATGQCLFQ